MNDSDKGWQSRLPDGLERWLRNRKPEAAPVGPGHEWRPSPDAPAPGVSSPDPSLRYQPPGVEWSPASVERCPSCGADFPGPYTPGTSQCCARCGAARPAAGDAVRTLDPDAVMAPPRPCVQCGGAVDADGYCTVCGFKAASERDHYREEPAPWVAGACDRGVKHVRNEDALALAASQEPGVRAVLVVCDGVSSSVDSDIASLAAAEAARDLLWNRPNTDSEGQQGVEEALVAAAAAANDAVVRTTDPASRNAASATFVAVVAEHGELAYANLGDSRAYWLPDAGEPVQLTQDHSVAEARIQLGAAREAAESGPGAHAITRWLGSDAPDIRPRTGRLQVGDGWLLVCSDGLWNYASTPAEVRTVLDAALAASPANLVDMCEHMVAWANAQGGKDNITVALARLGDLG
ncbi:MAG TPA: protein phosphatase 2C domain-containing protein [Propionibacteriaceae bacterium]|nr:protein phosphatase 2C domain-containing protein [Propionibacteriaceae bacterium]